MDSELALHPGSIIHIPESFSENHGRINLMLQRFIDSPAWNSGERLDNVNRTHLVLACVKLVLQKVCECPVIVYGMG